MAHTVLKRNPGAGIVRVGHELRVHVGPHEWLSGPATDYWIFAGSVNPITASGATNNSGLDSYGWTTTSLIASNLVTADFLETADDIPPVWTGNASADELLSTFIFGSYSHALQAAQILGRLPTKIVCEFYAAFTTASNNDVNAHIGFNRAVGTIIASIFSDGTNFVLRTTANIAGAATDTLFHQWRIVVDSATGLITWYIDGVLQPGSLAILADAWPSGFGYICNSNIIALAWAHLWYD